MSDDVRIVVECERYMIIPWTTPEGERVEKVLFAPDVTAEEAFAIVKSLGWLDHRVELE